MATCCIDGLVVSRSASVIQPGEVGLMQKAGVESIVAAMDWTRCSFARPS